MNPIVALIESDILASAGPALISFLTAFGAANGDGVKIGLAALKLQGDLAGALPTFEAALSQQLSTALIAKVNAAIAAHPAA